MYRLYRHTESCLKQKALTKPKHHHASVSACAHAVFAVPVKLVSLVPVQHPTTRGPCQLSATTNPLGLRLLMLSSNTSPYSDLSRANFQPTSSSASSSSLPASVPLVPVPSSQSQPSLSATVSKELQGPHGVDLRQALLPVEIPQPLISLSPKGEWCYCLKPTNITPSVPPSPHLIPYPILPNAKS